MIVKDATQSGCTLFRISLIAKVAVRFRASVLIPYSNAISTTEDLPHHNTLYIYTCRAWEHAIVIIIRCVWVHTHTYYMLTAFQFGSHYDYSYNNSIIIL